MVDRRRLGGDARLRARELLDDLREGSRWRPAFIAAAACNEMDADRGDPVGDSERGTEETSPLAAIAGRCNPIR